GFGRQMAKRRVVVENEEPAAEGRAHQIIFAPLNLQIAEGDDWNVGLKLYPVLASVDGEEQAELGAGKKQVLVDVILRQAPHHVPGREIGGDARPCLALVAASQHI